MSMIHLQLLIELIKRGYPSLHPNLRFLNQINLSFEHIQKAPKRNLLSYIYICAISRLIEMHNLQYFTLLYGPEQKAKQVPNDQEQGGDRA